MALEDVTIAGHDMHRAPPEELTVLVLDDDMLDLKRIERLLKRADFAANVVTCQDFDQLNTALDEHEFDVALIDNRLGAHRGADALRVISSHERAGPIPAIMVAGDTAPQDIVDSMKCGMRDYLGKSNLTTEMLAASIRTALDEPRFGDADLTEDQVSQLSQKVLAGVTKTCSEELGPVASRIFRRLNFIRDCNAMRVLPSPEVINAIEGDVLILRRFLDDLEAHEQSFVRPH
ncbi:MAG: response regulator [Pseudomonadota bacterium]